MRLKSVLSLFLNPKKIGLLLCLLLPNVNTGQKPPAFKEIMHFIPSDLEKARRLGDALLQDALQHGVDSSIAQANYALGLIFYYQDQNIVSAKYFQNALNQDFAKKNIDFSEKCLNNLGINYEILGKLDKALTAYQQSLKIAQKRKDEFGVAQTNLNIALLKSKAGDYESAINLNKIAQDYFLKVGSKENIGLTFLNAAVFYDKKDKSKAIENSHKATVIFENIKDTFRLIKCYSNLSKFYTDLKNYTKSDFYFKKADYLSDVFQSYGFKSSVLTNGIELNIQKKNFLLARKLLQEAEYNLASYPNIERKNELSAIKVRLSAYEGDIDEFENSFNQYVDETTKIIADNFNSDYEEWSIIYEKDKLTDSLKKMAKANKNKNKTIILFIIIIAIFIILLGIVILFHLKLRASYRKLYQLNNTSPDKLILDNNIKDSDSNEQKLYSLFLEIQQLMENENFFLRPGLTISDLSTALGSNDKYISLSINKYARMNFNHYINTLRIQEAKKLLLGTSTESSIQDIAITCGFGNASSFIRVFKQVTGLTPAYYVTLSKEMS
ncbi:MAG: helix-turn-helix domain-containing protein [Bacteroidetes bacterium]|nr:helix-turn-helix domain-containing protein [Bacteroidota bacterium]